MPFLNPAYARVMLTLLVLYCASWSEIVAQEVGAAEDKLAIAEQLAQYSYRWDSKDADGFAALFTEAGIMERWRSGALVRGSRVEGRQAILEYASASHHGRLADRQTRHHMSALVFVELSANAAITENMALITHQTADDRAPFISASGIYRNTWKKTNHGWKLAKRVLFTDRFTER